jgi:hypothetical protein
MSLATRRRYATQSATSGKGRTFYTGNPISTGVKSCNPTSGDCFLVRPENPAFHGLRHCPAHSGVVNAKVICNLLHRVVARCICSHHPGLDVFGVVTVMQCARGLATGQRCTRRISAIPACTDMALCIFPMKAAPPRNSCPCSRFHKLG